MSELTRKQRLEMAQNIIMQLEGLKHLSRGLAKVAEQTATRCDELSSALIAVLHKPAPQTEDAKGKSSSQES